MIKTFNKHTSKQYKRAEIIRKLMMLSKEQKRGKIMAANGFKLTVSALFLIISQMFS
jgi:hypothetical protein